MRHYNILQCTAFSLYFSSGIYLIFYPIRLNIPRWARTGQDWQSNSDLTLHRNNARVVPKVRAAPFLIVVLWDSAGASDGECYMHDMRQISCPMCGRSVTVSASGPVPCPSCGVPVSAPIAAEPPAPPASPVLADDDSATRIATIPPTEPAPVSASPAVASAAVPAAAPVSPASDITDPRTQPVSEAEVLQAAVPPVGAPPAAASVAATSTPEQPATQTYHATPQQDSATQQPMTQPYMPVVPPTQQPEQPAPKRNPALLIVGAVVAVVLLLGIIGAAVVFANHNGQKTVAQATPTITATATASVPAGFTQFTDADNVYKIDYPSGWTKTATSGDFSLTIFSGAPAHVPAVFEVEYFKTTLDPKTLQDQFFKGLALTGTVSNKQDPTTASLAGETWQSEAADVTMGQSTQHVVVLATNHGKYSVLIAYLAAKTSFDSSDTQDFQPMVSSFQFVP